MGPHDLGDGKKNAARRRATLVFADESGFSERPAIRRTWAPRGRTPVLTHRMRSWKQLSAIGAVAYHAHRAHARAFLMLHPGAVRSPQIVRFVRHLRRHIRGHVFLLWDGVNPHRSLETRAHLARQSRWLTVVRLPPYAPDLNPVEGMWGWIKGTHVANLCPESLAPVRQRLRRGRRALARRPDVLQGFLRRAGLFLPWM